MCSESEVRRPHHAPRFAWRRRVVATLLVAGGWLAVGQHAHADLTFDQIGADLQGGPAVAVSDGGDRIAVGSPGPDGAGFIGVVRVFARNGNAWTQLGADLPGETIGDQFGSSVSLSADGNRVAVGAWRNEGNGDAAWCTPVCPEGGHVRVFAWDGSAWAQLGPDIDGDYYAGNDVQLSSDGRLVAIASWSHVRVLEWDGSTWNEVGSRLPGGEGGLAMSADGGRIAVGFGTGQSSLSVHDWNGDDWIQVGGNIDSGLAGVDFANVGGVVMSASGNRVTATGQGAGFNPVNLTFDWDGSSWVRVGEAVEGRSWAMSDDGDRLVVDEPLQAYDWDGSNWIAQGTPPGSDGFPAISADGGIIAVGSGRNTRVFGVAAAPTTTPATTTPATTTPAIEREIRFEPGAVEPGAATLLRGRGWTCANLGDSGDGDSGAAAIIVLWAGSPPEEAIAEFGEVAVVQGEFFVNVTAPETPGVHAVQAYYSVEGRNACTGGAFAELNVVSTATSTVADKLPATGRPTGALGLGAAAAVSMGMLLAGLARRPERRRSQYRSAATQRSAARSAYASRRRGPSRSRT